ncbi:hypothetical protein HaLaN_19120 [Haematococcus lacustris]|uniref:Pherophorin domain-containing protein n=1 Tax=Haematococcus lacustris TaxID=44745 RepID=A0A699ZSN2_HAELA|nr:hypothetical protein HaLaN_19120 [Haematococcus lacustris]
MAQLERDVQQRSDQRWSASEMAYTRQVPRGPSAVVLTCAILTSLFMSATATFNSCTHYYENVNGDSTECCVNTGICSSDRCSDVQASTQARSWSWQIYGPGKFVFKVTNLALSSQPGPNYADGVVLQIVLRPGSACPSFDTFFPGRVYSIFNARQNCCPVAPLRLPSGASDGVV